MERAFGHRHVRWIFGGRAHNGCQLAGCRTIPRTTGGTTPGRALSTPIEAEWEYACRAGTDTPFAGGGLESDLARLAWYAGNSGGKPHPVAMKAPNGWGLYDMHGNVFEWCQDWEGPYPAEDAADPVGPARGEKRILRGGCFKCPPPYCRAANRYAAPPNRTAPNFGFRVVWSADGEVGDAQR